MHNGRYIKKVGDSEQRERPSYSAELLRVFADVLREHQDRIGDQLLRALELGRGRVPVDVAHQALLFAVERTGDLDLGLKAARRLILGDVGAVDYVVSSAPTVRSAIEQASRYTRLINDVLEVRLEIQGSVALVQFENSVVLPRAAADFEVGGFFRNHVCGWLGSRVAELTVWFPHESPADLSEYKRTFAPASLRFSAPVLGFAFDSQCLDLPLPRADRNLQQILIPYADQRLSQLPTAKSVTADVRSLVAAELAGGGPDVAAVASRLGMSLRTLARRLEAEGTSFRELVDDVRQQAALEWVGQRSLPFSEIADRLGFSHAAAFHRAFRRWTGQTPLRYRKARGR